MNLLNKKIKDKIKLLDDIGIVDDFGKNISFVVSFMKCGYIFI